MVVAHNLLAMNAQRMLNITTGKQRKSTEKLSSGYRINRAADDAAGLSISEKMRKQIKGLDRASTNASDGISAVQTAEGALNEVHSMLHRMNELAIQSANGTNSESDRTAIQNEIDQLTTEVDRVSETTKFNETYLLKGDESVTKKVSWRYNNYAASVTATARMNADATTGLAVSGSFTSSASQDDQNYILRAMRDSGLYVSQNRTYDATTGGITEGYTMQLTGDAAQRYQVVTISTYSTTNLINNANASAEGVFSIQTMGGEEVFRLAVTGGNAPAPTSTDQYHSASAIITASDVTAARRAGEQAQYYDRDGNRIPQNALNRYFDLASGSIQGAVGSSTSSTTTVTPNTTMATTPGSGTVGGSSGSTGSTTIGTGSSSGSSSTTVTYNSYLLTFLTDSNNEGEWTYDGSVWSNPSASTTYSTENLSSTAGLTITGNVVSGDKINLAVTNSTASVSYPVETDMAGVTLTLNDTTLNDTTELNRISNHTWTYSGTWDNENGANMSNSLSSGMITYFNVSGNWNPQLGNYIKVNGATTVNTPTAVSASYQPASGGNSSGRGQGGSLSGGGTTVTPTTPTTTTTTTTTVNGNGIVTKPSGGLVYDAVGNLTSLNVSHVNAKRDLKGDMNLSIHVGADATRDNKILINIACMSSKNLGINGLRVDGRDDTNAMDAIDRIKEALQKVSDQRALLGACQNRLEHTIANLDNVVENTEAAESRIRDTDMAEEMVTYSKNNILAQAGQSVLAQANQSNQGVVSLLG